MRNLAFLLVTLLALIAPILAPAQSGEDDKGYLTRLIEENLSGAGREVLIEGFQGALSSTATIDRLTISDEAGVWLDMTNLSLDWSRAALLAGRIEVTNLSAGTIAISRYPMTEAAPAKAESTPFSLPELPVSVRIDSLTAAQITLGPDFLGEEVKLDFAGALALEGGTGSAKFTSHRLDGANGRFDITASYDNISRTLDLNLLLDEAEDGIAARVLDVPGRPSVRLAVAGNGPLENFSATLALNTAGVDRLTGGLTILAVTVEDATDISRRDISIDLSGDVTALLLPEYRDFFGPSVSLRTNLSQDANGITTLSALDLKTRSLQLGGQAVFGAGGWPRSFSLTGTIADETGAPVRLPIGGAPTLLGRADLKLGFDASQNDRWTADLDIAEFTRPGLTIPDLSLTGGGSITNGEGDAIGAFTADLDYGAAGLRLDNAAVAEALGDTIAGQLSLVRTEGAETVLRSLTLRGSGLGVDASGTVGTPDQGYVVQTTIALAAERLERFAALAGQPLQGAADLGIVASYRPETAAFTAFVTGTTLDLGVGITQLDPLLVGKGNLTFLAERDGTGTRLKGLSIETPSTSLLANASLSSIGGSADLILALDDIGRSVPGLTGPLDLRANATRDETGVSLVAAALTAGEDTALLEATIPADLAGEMADFDLTASITDLARLAPVVGRDLAGSVEAQLTGSSLVSARQFDLTLDAKTQSIRTGLPSVDVLLRGPGTLSAVVERPDSGGLVLRSLAAQTPQISLDATLEGQDGAGNARFDARLSDVAIYAPDFPGPATVTGTATLDTNGVWSVDTSAVGPGGATAALAGTVTSDMLLDLGVKGRAPLGLLNATLEPRRISGIADFDLAVRGPANPSSLFGTITATGAEFSAPTLGQSIQNLNAVIQLNGGTAGLDVSGALADGGDLTAAGDVSLSAPFNANLVATVAGAVLRDPELYSTVADGRITVTGPLGGGAAIAGLITLGLTELRVPSSDIGALGDLPTVRHLSPSSAVRQSLTRAGLTTEGREAAATGPSGPAYSLDITVSAPSRIFVRGRGLDAELGGALALGGTTANVIPSGQFNLLRGRLDILQQRFDLTEGLAAIQGDFQPYVRLVATTTARTGTRVNVTVEGAITEPSVVFSSQPDLPQDEILAQLIFGRDLSQITPLQAVQLASAVSTLAGRGGEGLVGRLRGGIGLDDLDVTTDANGDAAVRAGKYISENLYTDVTVSSGGSSEISLNLDITSDITAKGAFSSDGESSVGVFFERDY